MIIGIGIDQVEIARFKNWGNRKNLARIFSQQELAYSLSVPVKMAERLALRFAAKEALFKALQPILREHNKKISLLTLCRAASYVFDDHKLPMLKVDWKLFDLAMHENNTAIHVSASHSGISTVVVVVLEKI